MNYLDIYTIQSQVYINIFLDNYKYKNNIYMVKLSLIIMNTLLYLSLAPLIVEPKLG